MPENPVRLTEENLDRYWKEDATEEDYTLAEAYLRLHLPSGTDGGNEAAAARTAMRRAPRVPVLARHILDGAVLTGRQPLAKDDQRVASLRQTIVDGKEKLSPVLIMSMATGPIIADGFDRVCAAYSMDLDAVVGACIFWRHS
jgi:hypothetical protein